MEIQLLTHAQVMFANECLGTLAYEATASSIVMAGLFVSFLVEFCASRFITSRSNHQSPSAEDDGMPNPKGGNIEEVPLPLRVSQDHNHSQSPRSLGPQPTTKLAILTLESGIIFHSVLIGLTLVVAGDSFYLTLLAVIVFHQFFEGLALGVRIALLPDPFIWTKLSLAIAFAAITPLGMAIGLGVLRTFNGNEPSTIVAIGTLDALSAGILLWAGMVDMWARDWVFEDGEMVGAALGQVIMGLVALMAGMGLMALLGKWA